MSKQTQNQRKPLNNNTVIEHNVTSLLPGFAPPSKTTSITRRRLPPIRFSPLHSDSTATYTPVVHLSYGVFCVSVWTTNVNRNVLLYCNSVSATFSFSSMQYLRVVFDRNDKYSVHLMYHHVSNTLLHLLCSRTVYTLQQETCALLEQHN